MKKIFLFSGLGADSRAFSNMDFSGFEVVHVEWLAPEKSEALDTYVHRLAVHYQIPKTGAYVIGVSFGGMCISELAKSYDFEKIVLISSAKTKDELPKSYVLSKIIPLHRLLSDRQLTTPNLVLDWLFGIEKVQEKELLATIIRSSDPLFVKWAMDKIIRWSNTVVPANFLHIHGDKDRIIPFKNIGNAIRIKGGGHFMIVNRANEISIIIKKFLL